MGGGEDEGVRMRSERDGEGGVSTALTSIYLRLCPVGNDGERVRTDTSEVTWHTGSCVE